MAEIRVIGIRKEFGRGRSGRPNFTDLMVPGVGVQRALEGVRRATGAEARIGPFRLEANLEVPHGRTMVILGPSGCGKTTLLRLVAGLEEPDSGQVLYDGRDMAGVPPGDRRLGIVFQDYALYPSFTSRQNILAYFGFRKRTPALDAEARARFEQTAALLGVDLAYLLDRKPAGLSAGEKQRVALGRCITRDPALFLLDEPFANLDQQLRERYRANLRRLLRELAVTTIHVTHDQHEALVLADLIAVMDVGRIVQVGTYQEIYREPASLFVAAFFNPDPLTPALSILEGGTVAPALRDTRVGVRPEDVQMAAAGAGPGVQVEIRDVMPVPTQPYVVAAAAVGESELLARLPVDAGVRPGDRVWLHFARLHVFDAVTGARVETLE